MGRIDTARAGLHAQHDVDTVLHVSGAQLAAGAASIDQLVTHLQRVLAASDPAADDAHDVAASVTAAKANGVQDMNAIRERYMAASITAKLAKPGLVKIGDGHVARVAAAVPGAIGHADYAAFAAAATSDKVLNIQAAAAAEDRDDELFGADFMAAAADFKAGNQLAFHNPAPDQDAE
jgi:hypothetical protein